MLRLATDIHRRSTNAHRPPMDMNRRATVIDHFATDIRQTAPDIRQPAMRVHRQMIEAHIALILPRRPAIHANRIFLVFRLTAGYSQSVLEGTCDWVPVSPDSAPCRNSRR
jgi:hypothetical protein